MPARCSHKTVAGPQAPHGSREGPSTQRGTMRTRGHACTGTHAHGNMHTQRNTPTSLRGGCCRADGVARLQNHACAHPRCDAMARTAARSPWQARHTGVQACVQWGRPDPPLCGQRRWQRELSSLSPSDCLLRHESHTIPVPRFPHWSSWPQAISQERNQTAPGAPSACSAPGWGPRAPAALRIQPMRSVLHACPRTRHTC